MTPLLWADSPSAVLHQIYREARRAIPWPGGGASWDRSLSVQPYLRKVSAEFHRRLKLAGIYVENQ